MVLQSCFLKQVVALLILVVSFSVPAAATYTLTSNIPTDISSCQEVVFDLTLSNPGPAAQAAGTLQYCLPQGIRFAQITGLTLFDLADLRCPVFNVPAIPVNGSLSFQLRVQVGCFETDQGDLRDTIRIVSGGVPAPLLFGSAYNVRIPVITLHPGPNWDYAGAIGEEFTRSFYLRNDGFGTALYLFMIDSFAAGGLQLVQTTGTFMGDTLILSGADLGPNGLKHLDSVLVTQTFQITDCSTHSVVVSYGWACPDGEVCSPARFDSYQLSGGNIPSPAVVTTLNNAFAIPKPCEPQVFEILVENTGAAAALNLEWLQGLMLDATTPAGTGLKFDCFPISSFQVAGVSLVDSSNGNQDIPYQIIFSGISADPDGAGGLSDEDGDGQFDDLAPGSSFLMQCTVELNPACKLCNGLQTVLFVGAQLNYANSCGDNLSASLAENVKLDLSFNNNEFEEDHQFILDADSTYDFFYTINALSPGLLDLCANDSIILEFILPEVLSLPPGFQALFDSVAVPFWTVGDSLLYLLLPGLEGELILPVLPTCPPDIDNSAVCTPPYEPRTYRMAANLRWTCGNGCGQMFDLVCLSGRHFTIDCPRPDDNSQQHGVFADTVWVKRVSVGFVDNEMSALINPATPGLSTNVGIPYDTVLLHAEARFEGTIGDVYDSTQLQVYYWNGGATYFEPLSATLQLEDAETGLTILCPSLTLDYRLVNGYHIWEADLLPLMQPGGCFAGNGIQLTPGDRLTLELQVILTETWPYLDVEEVKDLRVRFPYVYHGDSLLCETKNALFRGINPDFDYAVDLDFPDTICHDLAVDIIFYQGISGRVTDDLFPNEIRPLSVYDTLVVQLDPGYSYQPGSTVWEYELGDGAAGIPVPTLVPLADPQAIVLPGGEDALLFVRPLGLPVTDYYMGRAPATLHFRAQALCPPDTTKLPVHILGHRLLSTLDVVNVDVEALSVGDPDFNELLLTTFTPLSSSREPVWFVEYCNSGASFAIETPMLFVQNGPAVELASARDVTNPQVPQVLNIVPVDGTYSGIQGLTLEPNACRTVELKAQLADCFTDTLRLFPGFQCDAAAPPCIIPHPLELYFIPKISIAQVNVSGSPDTAVNLCAPVDYSIKILNVGDGFMYDIELRLELPPAGQTLVPGSSFIEYNGQQVPLPDPAQDPDGLVWQLDFSQLPFGLEALPSILFVQANSLIVGFQLETNCEYIDGTRFLYTCSWADACGGGKKTTPFVAPPLQIIGAPTTTNTYQVVLEMDNPASFCAENTFQVRIVNPGNLGATAANENVRIVFPNVFSYVPGSLMAVHNGPGVPPAVLPFGDETYLSFDLPAGVVAGDSMVFTFRLLNAESIVDCQAPYDFRVQMTQTSNVACLNSTCAIDFVLLEDQFSSVFQKPVFVLSGLSGLGLPIDAGLEDWQLEFEIGNLSNIAGGGALQLEIRLDENQNAQLDATDPLLQSFTVNVEGLLPGASQLVQQNVEVASTNGCSGIWLLLVDTLCSCTLDSVFIPFVRLENAGGDQVVCAGSTLALGFQAQNAAVYEWIPASPYLDNAAVSNPNYQYTGPFDASLEFSETLILKTTRSQGCVSFDTIQVSTRQVELSLTPTPVLCWGDSTGSVQAMLQGAADTVLFSWSNGAMQGTQLDMVPAGIYSLSITDAYGCTASASAEVLEPAQLDASILASDFNGFGISCSGASDGSLEAMPSGGVGGYQFDWLPAGSGPLLTGLPPGVYALTLTDANACTATVEATLVEPPALGLSLVVADEICPDGANGSITATVQGGVAPYTSGGQTVAATFVLDNLTAGAYNLAITDANGCTIAADTVVTGQFSTFTTLADSVTCFGGNDGYAEITGAGHPPFGYNWSDGSSANAINGPAGVYTCTVSDALGCNYVLEIAIEQPAELVAMAAVDSVGCFGDSTGQIVLSGIGGVLPYSFFENGQPAGPTIDNLPAGFYTFSIVDGNACSATLQVEIAQPVELVQSFTVTDALCFDSNTGRIEALADGGTAPYSYAWSNGGQGAVLDSIPAGIYVSNLTDASGCTRMDTVAVGQPEPYLPVFDLIRKPCADRANGILALSGFPEGTRYGLNQGPLRNDPLFNGVAGGDLVLQVEDSLGCRFEFEYFVTAFPENLGLALADTVMHLGDSAWLRVVLPPDFLPGEIQFQWLEPLDVLSGCDTCPELWVQPFKSANYTVRFSTESGCTSESSVVVQILRDSVYAPNVIFPGAQLHENQFFTLYGRTDAIQQVNLLRIFDRWGSLVFEREGFQANDPVQGWDGRRGSKELLPGVYVWYAEVLFLDGRLLLVKGDVTLVR